MIKKEIRVVKEFMFEAAHFLPQYPGKCRNLHGHSYKLQVGIKGGIDACTGMVIDFSEIKKAVKSLILDNLDHAFLNESILPDFPSTCSTAENMVIWIAERLMLFKNHFANLQIDFIRLYETATSYAEWRNEKC